MDWKSVPHLNAVAYKPSTWKLHDITAAKALKSSHELSNPNENLEPLPMKRTVICSNGQVQSEDYLQGLSPSSLGIVLNTPSTTTLSNPTSSASDLASYDATTNEAKSTLQGDTASVVSVSDYSVASGASITRISFTPDSRYAIPSAVSYLEALSIANSVGTRAYDYITSKDYTSQTSSTAIATPPQTYSTADAELLVKQSVVLGIKPNLKPLSMISTETNAPSSPTSTSASQTAAAPIQRMFGVKSHISMSKSLITRTPLAMGANVDESVRSDQMSSTTTTSAETKSSNSNPTTSTSLAPATKPRSNVPTETTWINVTVVDNEATLQERPGYMLDTYGRIIKPRKATSGLVPDHFSDMYDTDMEGGALSAAEVEQAARAEAARSLQEVRRQVKWLAMLADWNVYTTSKSNVLKERIRKGIPHVFRGAVWQSLLGTQARRAEVGPDFYQSLLKQPLRVDDDVQLCRDIPRAYQDYAYFKSPEGGSRTVVCPGQAALFRVLHAYAVYDPPVGYVQGMDVIAGLALMLMPEEEAFYFLERQMIARGMRKIYLHHMVVAHEYVYVHRRLLRKHLPKLYAFLEQMAKTENSALPKYEYTYCLRWYIKRFGEFAPEFFLRVMDMCLYEGDKALYRVALAVLMHYEPHLLAARPTDSGDLLHMLTQIASAHDWQVANLDEIMKTACRIRITRAGVQALRTEYAKFREKAAPSME